MAKIYLPEWDFSVDQFAVTDNNTQWLLRISDSGGGSIRQFYKKNNIVCIYGLSKNYQSGHYFQSFAMICIGTNSTKTEQDAKDAIWIKLGSPTGSDMNVWRSFVIPEFPNLVVWFNASQWGYTNPGICQIREPLMTYDWQGRDMNMSTGPIDIYNIMVQAGIEEGTPSPIDPYSPDGPTDTGGGNGNHDRTSDPIPTSPLPSLAAADTKFISLYNPSLTELNNLAAWMWSPLCVIDDLRKLWNNPMQGILGLSIVPVQPTRAAAPSTIYLGNLESNTSAYKITSQYVSVPMGFVSIDEYFGSYLDYAPYTKIEIYLPYIGTRELNTDDVMGKDVYCYYHVDVMSGACVALLMCGNAVLYQFAGNCASSIPITGNDWTNVINGVMSVAISTAMVATGNAVGGAASAAAAVSAVGSVAQNIASMKPTVMKSGSLAGGSGFLGIQKPYLIITRPNAAVPDVQNTYTGYPAWITMSLSGLTGLTYVAECHLEGIPCTTEEQKEIETILKNGVIL